MIICNATCGTVLAIDAEDAGSLWRHMRGLIVRTDLPTGYGLVVPCCKAIHSFGMRVWLDLLFLDEGARPYLLSIMALGPYRMAQRHRVRAPGRNNLLHGRSRSSHSWGNCPHQSHSDGSGRLGACRHDARRP
jgi:hypothetical protein